MAPTTRSKTKAQNGVAPIQPSTRPQSVRRTVTPLQQTRSSHAGRISKRWPITRRNKLSRGIRNLGQTCYRNGPLQALLHMPKFLNLMLEHNKRVANGTINQCTPLTPQEQNARLSCIACTMKTIIQGYWGDLGVQGNNAPDSIPIPRVPNEPNRAQQLRAAFDNLHNWVDYQIRQQNQDVAAQQDAHEYLLLLLDGCFAATSPPGLWTRQFEALFRYDREVFITCNAPNSQCRARRNVAQPGGSWGISPIEVHIRGADSISQALGRHLGIQDWNSVQCNACNITNTHQITERVEAAPEILLLQLNLTSMNMNGSTFKITNGITLDEEIDLTAYQLDTTTSLRYRLKSVVAHVGANFDRGHWIANLKAYGRRYMSVNDSNARVVDKAFFLSNPSVEMKSSYNAVILGYERIQNPKRMVTELL